MNAFFEPISNASTFSESNVYFAVVLATKSADSGGLKPPGL